MWSCLRQVQNGAIPAPQKLAASDIGTHEFRRARLLGKEGDDADAYAKTVVKSDFEEPGEEDVVRKVVADLAATDASEADVRKQMSKLLETVMGEEE